MKKEIFVYFGMVLLIGALVLVFTKTITYNEFLTSGATLVGIVGALYGWFADKEIKGNKKVIDELKNENLHLRSENFELSSTIDDIYGKNISDKKSIS